MTNGADEENTASDQPTAPTEPADAPDATQPAPTEAAASPGPPPPSAPTHSGGWLVPKWVVAGLVSLVAVGVLLGSGIAIGRATASGGDDERRLEREIEELLPRERDERDERPRLPELQSGVFLGVSTQEATGDQQGAEILNVAPDSPAAGAGLQEGDVITAVDGTAVTGPADLARVVRSHEPGDRVTIAYSRGGNPAEVQVELADRSTESEREQPS
jgi:membrane-associated protease RseP (regulator of RpoE activity)